jgi:hypothetical protein
VKSLLCACNPFGPRALPIATSVPILDGYVAARAEASPSGRPLGRWRERSVQGGAADGVGAGRSNVCAPPRQIRLRSCRNASLMRLAQRARSASHVARGRSLFPGNISRVVGGAPAAPTSDGGADRWPERGCAGIQGAALRTVILVRSPQAPVLPTGSPRLRKSFSLAAGINADIRARVGPPGGDILVCISLRSGRSKMSRAIIVTGLLFAERS